MEKQKIKELKDSGVLHEISDIFRTSSMNPHFPHGLSCDACSKCGNKCTYDSDGEDCNYAFVEYLEKELLNRCE